MFNNLTMDIKNFNKKSESETENISKKELNALDNKVLSKDEEIKKLKAQLAEAKSINKLKTGDIRAELNSCGDAKLICIGTNDSGQRVWKKANELTDADIERRNNYIANIKQLNAKRH
jgi:hypothetical protein